MLCRCNYHIINKILGWHGDVMNPTNCPSTKEGSFCRALGNILKNRVPGLPKFPIQCTNEGGEVSEFGEAHLHERNLGASTKFKEHYLSQI